MCRCPEAEDVGIVSADINALTLLYVFKSLSLMVGESLGMEATLACNRFAGMALATGAGFEG